MFAEVYTHFLRGVKCIMYNNFFILFSRTIKTRTVYTVFKPPLPLSLKLDLSGFLEPSSLVFIYISLIFV